MENCDILIGVLLVIVFVLLVQRTVSPFRCQEGEEEKDGNCVSNSTKDKWWAFWESPVCKRGELQSDYTCLASMIWDAVSPGTASSPQAPPPVASIDQATATLTAVQPMIDFAQRNFFSAPGEQTEYTINIGVREECPVAHDSKIQIGAVLPKVSIDMAMTQDFRRLVDAFFTDMLVRTGATGDERAAMAQAISWVVQDVNAEHIIQVVNSTINNQDRKINIAVCKPDSPIRSEQNIAAAAVINNLVIEMFQKYEGQLSKLKGATGGQVNMAVENRQVEGEVQREVQMAVENRQVEGVVQTAVEASCKPRGTWADRQNHCCSGRYSVPGLIPGTPGPCA